MAVLKRFSRLKFASIVLFTAFTICGWISFLKYDKFVKFQRPHVNINCSQLLNKNKTEILAVKKSMALHGSASAALVMYNCNWLKGYLSGNFYVSELEQHFPLAFTLVVHNSPDQVLRLLRILYRDHNSFCIHCDKKSPHNSIFRTIASCFDNIVVPRVEESVVWGHSSILKAEMRCMEELTILRKKQRWKWEYLLNLCGKEVPIVTNREMVIRLMKLKGRSHINVRVKRANYLTRIKFGPKLNKDKTKIVSNKKDYQNLRLMPPDISTKILGITLCRSLLLST